MSSWGGFSWAAAGPPPQPDTECSSFRASAKVPIEAEVLPLLVFVVFFVFLV